MTPSMATRPKPVIYDGSFVRFYETLDLVEKHPSPHSPDTGGSKAWEFDAPFGLVRATSLWQLVTRWSPTYAFS
jgi:hypothetical protein